MKVKLAFLDVLNAVEIFGAQKFEFEMKGKTVKDLLNEIIEGYGHKAKELFFKSGRYDSTFQIIINGRKYVLPEEMERFTLAEGDTVIFSPLVNGG